MQTNHYLGMDASRLTEVPPSAIYQFERCPCGSCGKALFVTKDVCDQNRKAATAQGNKFIVVCPDCYLSHVAETKPSAVIAVQLDVSPDLSRHLNRG